MARGQCNVNHVPQPVRDSKCSDDQFDGSLFLKMKKIRTCSPFGAVMVQVDRRHRFVRPQELQCWSETHSKSFVLLCQGGPPSRREVPYPETQVYLSLKHPYKHRNRTDSKTLARTCSESGCRWTHPIFKRPSEQNIVSGSRKFEVCLCGRSSGCRGCHTDFRSWIRDKRIC